jgi:hypothetical protein
LTGSVPKEIFDMTRTIVIGVASFATTAILLLGQYAAIGAIG